MIGDYVGMVYIITNTQTGKKYVGQKRFWSKVTRPPLKGKKRKRKSVKESNWQTYCGSSEEVKTLVEENGLEFFDREILHLCKTFGELSYVETKEQFDREVLLKPNEYYNAMINCRINRNHIKHLIKDG